MTGTIDQSCNKIDPRSILAITKIFKVILINYNIKAQKKRLFFDKPHFILKKGTMTTFLIKQ